MKQDLRKKAPYLQFLRAKQSFIQPCGCDKKVHAYCITAQIIKRQKINCSECDSYYKLYTKKEKLCSGQLALVMSKYFAILVGLLIFSIFFLIFDGYLKSDFAKENPDVIEKYLAK